MSGVEIRDYGMNAILRNIQMLPGRAAIEVGVFDDARDNRGAIAYWMEYGTEKIPPRPFMMTTSILYEARINAIIERNYDKVVQGIQTPNQLMGIVGRTFAEYVRDTIRSSTDWAAPNAASTQAKKGSNAPLRDTLTLLYSVTWRRAA